MITLRIKTLQFLKLLKIDFKQCQLCHSVVIKNDISRTRNIGILAHIDAGKTTTTERLLYFSGKIKSMGEVHKGNTVTDYMEQERNRGITITSACVTFFWNNHLINLVDTPGHIDFTVEVEQALNVIDSAVVVLDGTAGVEVQTITVWRQADKKFLPRLVYANKMDRPDSDIDLCEQSLRNKLGATPFLLQFPLKEKSRFSSIVDLITLTVFQWSNGHYVFHKLDPSDSIYSTCLERRNKLIDDLSSFDDKLADIVLSSESFDGVSADALKESVRKCTLLNHGVPVICGSSYKNVGVELLLNSILDYLPAPTDTVENNIYMMSKNEFVAKTFKVMHDKQKGPLVFFRIYSGSVSKGNKIFDFHKEKGDHISHLFKPFADELTEVAKASCGDFVAASGLKIVQNGDIICNNSSSAKHLKELCEKHEDKLGKLFQQNHIPKPVVFCSIEPPSLAYQNALEKALSELSREDPSLNINNDSETGQTILGGMGELHLEIIKDRLMTDYKIDADIGPMQILYKEKPLKSLQETHTLKNLLGSSEVQVTITLSIKVGSYEDILHLDKSRESAQNLSHLTPRQLGFVKHGVVTALNKGPLMACEVVDCHAVLHHLEMSRKVPDPLLIAATSQCVEKILKCSGTQLLEPVMEVNIVVDESFLSVVQGDLSRRRAEILDISSKLNSKEITCDVPLSELVGYAKQLRTATSGSARFTMEFKDYKEMSSVDQERVLKNKLVEIRRPNSKKAHIRYKPSIEDQEKNLGGQLIVRYDVERTSEPGGQILVNDGYFVHFFAPEGLPPIRKLAVFVLDLSGSMEGRKVDQLKTAMGTILDDLGERDHFNIVDFSYSVTVHSLDSPAGSVVLPPDTSIAKTSDIPPPYPKTTEYIMKAKQVISKMSSGGGTNIYDALKNAIIVAQSGVEKIKKQEGENEKEDTLEPIVIFLTDGDPTVGITKHSRILNMVKEFNNPRCSIFSLGFGNGADMRFLRKLSLGNAGFARSIYEAADAALQLSNFYKEVASPLLSNVTFTYLPGQVIPGSVTKDSFSSLFLGSELVVAGKLSSSDIESKIEGTTANGTTSFQAKPLRNPDDISAIEYIDDQKTTEELQEELKGEKKHKKKMYLRTNLERVWAYLTIQQFVNKLDSVEGNSQLENDIRKQAVNLALKYKFVTPFTSLIVVKPNKTEEVSSGKDQSNEFIYKNKIAYLQGALYGFPAQFAPSRIDIMATQPGSYSSTTIDRIDAGVSEEDVYHSSTEEDYGMTESGSRLYLEDITWLAEVYSWENSTITLPRGKDNATEIYLFLNATSADYHGKNCTLTDNVEGVCRHVTDCILPQFAFSLQEYMHNYFCLIDGGFAGTCCPELVDTSTPYYYSSTGYSSESNESWTLSPTTIPPQTD